VRLPAHLHSGQRRCMGPSLAAPRLRDVCEPSDGPIDELITRWADHDRLALVFEGAEVSYQRLADRVDAVAAGLIAAGVDHGDRVIFCGLNRVELIETLLACCRIGAVFCPINNRLTPTEVAVLVADCRPKLLLSTDGFDELLLAAVALADGDHPIDTEHTADGDQPIGTEHTADGDHPIVNLETNPFPDRPLETPASASTLEDPALMVYTSGTTGTPKGAVHTQASLLATWRNSIDHQGLTGDDCIVAALPTFHVGGLNIQTLPTLMVGGLVVIQRRFDPGALLDAIRVRRPTQTLLVPAMLAAVAAHPEFTSTDLSSLEGINSGSSVVPEAVMRPFFDRGVPVGQVYGTTETGPTAVVLDYADAAARLGSCGRPALLTELRIVDASGHDVDSGSDGELWVRGPNVFSHYWENPDATVAAFVDGWFRTGDVGHRDRDGFVTIADRVTDVIISGGENVYPAEVEAALVGHPAIADVAVIGKPDERWGETPVAVVILAPGTSLELDELRSWCEGRIARFKQPRALVMIEELPRTALGKVRKHELRAKLAD